jgi:lipopolysaccharide export system protein LptC
VSARNALAFLTLLLAAVGTWYLAGYLREPPPREDQRDAPGDNFYLRSARILGTDAQGQLLYEIRAEYAEQHPSKTIDFRNVHIRYSTEASVPWVLDADTATIEGNQERVILRGHVRLVSEEGLEGQVTEIRTPYLEFDPQNFRAETDSRVQIRVGARSLTATGMLALLQEDRLQLKSNVSGKFVP